MRVHSRLKGCVLHARVKTIILSLQGSRHFCTQRGGLSSPHHCRHKHGIFEDDTSGRDYTPPQGDTVGVGVGVGFDVSVGVGLGLCVGLGVDLVWVNPESNHHLHCFSFSQTIGGIKSPQQMT